MTVGASLAIWSWPRARSRPPKVARMSCLGPPAGTWRATPFAFAGAPGSGGQWPRAGGGLAVLEDALGGEAARHPHHRIGETGAQPRGAEHLKRGPPPRRGRSPRSKGRARPRCGGPPGPSGVSARRRGMSLSAASATGAGCAWPRERGASPATGTTGDAARPAPMKPSSTSEGIVSTSDTALFHASMTETAPSLNRVEHGEGGAAHLVPMGMVIASRGRSRYTVSSHRGRFHTRS